jgi:hypothetical protein
MINTISSFLGLEMDEAAKAADEFSHFPSAYGVKYHVCYLV